jgi:3-demethoxyubiquinol 3-hydroxylase
VPVLFSVVYNLLMNILDRFICELDAGLRTAFAPAYAERPLPEDITEHAVLPATASESTMKSSPDIAAREESIRLMRVNHAGEVSAQALYQGQALVAKTSETRAVLQHAAREERDHLAWCETRINELGGAVSRLNPLFYAGSFALGVASGVLGDKWSMGFLVETERQVEAHLGDHLGRLPEEDSKSRRILEAMREDEIHHGQTGMAHGAATLPVPIRSAMKVVSTLMTRSAYWV